MGKDWFFKLVAAANIMLLLVLLAGLLGVTVTAFQAVSPLQVTMRRGGGFFHPAAPALMTQNSPTLENFGLQRTDPEGSVLGLTENQALTYKSTGSKCLDLYNDVLPHTSRTQLVKYLEAAWNEDPLTTLKLIFQLGDPRKGKSDRLNLHQALLWLYHNHFETLLLNAHQLGRFSYHKSMLELMVLVVDGPAALDDKRVRSIKDHNYHERRRATRQRNIEKFFQGRDEERIPATCEAEECKDSYYYDGLYGWTSKDLREQFVAFMHQQDQKVSKKARVARKEKEATMLRKAEDLYRSDDTKFRRLYDRVADHFADGLKEERSLLENGDNNTKPFGLVAKWAPSPGRGHDRRTNICEGIIQRLYPNSYKYRDVDLRARFFREYLSSIRRAAEIPESFIGSGEWHLVNYNRMPSRCRALHGEMYRRHDQERYDDYINQAKNQAERGERITMVAAGALLPHEIITRASRSNINLNDELGLQWLRLIQDIKDSGKLPNALAICDVSGSMYQSYIRGALPVDVSVALAMLVADVTDGFYGSRVITFSQTPELVQLPKATVDNLASRVTFMRGMHWGYNTDFQKVFDLILADAQKQKLEPSKLPSILFCISDMEFDQAHGGGNWKTDLELMRSKYAKAGYQVPTIVFWNLRDSGSKAASFEEPGVVMLSGFSAGMLKAFLELRLDEIKLPTPYEQMLETLRPYEDLVLAAADDEDLDEEGGLVNP